MAEIEKTLLTLDDLMQPENERVEIINGEVKKKMAASGRHNIVVGNIYYFLRVYNQTKNAGAVYTDGLHYLMFSPSPSLKDSYLLCQMFLSFVRRISLPIGTSTSPTPVCQTSPLR